jgi:hypothetical protein
MTVSFTAVVWLRLPETPVIVRVTVPGVAVAVTEIFRVTELPVVELGEKVAVVPEPGAVTENATEPAKPPVRVMVTV